MLPAFPGRLRSLIGDEVAAQAEESRLHALVMDTSSDDVQRARDTQQDIAAQLDESRGQVQTLRGRMASLEALQQAALGQDDDQAVEWLQRNGLTEKPALHSRSR